MSPARASRPLRCYPAGKNVPQAELFSCNAVGYSVVQCSGTLRYSAVHYGLFRKKLILETIMVLLRTDMVLPVIYMIFNGTNIVNVGKLST